MPRKLSDIIPGAIDTVMLDTLPRLLRHELTVRSFGVKPASREVLDETFRRYGFGFILRGRGSITEEGVRHPVEAPCLLRHLCGRRYRQCPEPEWDEFYITFPASARPVFERPPWTLLGAPAIRLPDAEAVLERLERLFRCFRTITTFGMADRFDLEAASLLLDLLGTLRPDSGGEPADPVSQLRHYLESHCLEAIDYGSLAARFGVSPRHLRRLWEERHGEPPTAYVRRLRMKQAEYLLAETDMRIGEAAAMLNMRDPLYFSRKFREFHGCSPAEYRRRAAEEKLQRANPLNASTK
ncbi:MAG: helix-turn-helix transcriptional regulator [Lentisphaeria bacterium]|nr:helix-turn-helix transcriptional regulator [Lentisphaeria bacterium]